MIGSWMKRGLLAAVAALCASGCASMATMQTANTLGEEKMQVGLETTYQRFGDSNNGFAYPHLNVAVRYGVTDSIDVGGRIGQSGTEFMAKFQLTDKASSTVLSLAPSVGGFALGADDETLTSLYYQVPLLVGFSTTGGSQLVLGPKIQHWLLMGGGGTVGLLNVGATVGYAAKIGNSFWLMPEVGAFYPLAVHGSSSNGGDIAVGEVEGSILHFGLGMLFGG